MSTAIREVTETGPPARSSQRSRMRLNSARCEPSQAPYYYRRRYRRLQVSLSRRHFQVSHRVLPRTRTRTGCPLDPPEIQEEIGK